MVLAGEAHAAAGAAAAGEVGFLVADGEGGREAVAVGWAATGRVA